MAQKKKTTSTVHASPSAAAAHFAQEAKAALAAGQAVAGEDIQAAPSAPTPDEICWAVEHCFGEDPETVLAPLQRGAEVLQWLEAICHCIGTTLVTEDVSSAIPLAKSLADCGKWLAGDQANGYLEPEFDNMMSKVAAAMHEKPGRVRSRSAWAQDIASSKACWCAAPQRELLLRAIAATFQQALHGIGGPKQPAIGEFDGNQAVIAAGLAKPFGYGRARDAQYVGQFLSGQVVAQAGRIGVGAHAYHPWIEGDTYSFTYFGALE